jgi:CheY-like chemotaxis protein
MKRFVILLVDDEERILNFLKTKLKSLTYEVIPANNGIEAPQFSTAQSNHANSIILDRLWQDVFMI